VPPGRRARLPRAPTTQLREESIGGGNRRELRLPALLGKGKEEKKREKKRKKKRERSFLFPLSNL